IAVLKQTSPTACPVAPSPKPSSKVPSASTSTAVGIASTQPEFACLAVMGPYLRILSGEARARFGRFFWKGDRAARRHQQCLEAGHEGRRQAPRLDAAPGQFGAQERRHRGARARQGTAVGRGAALPLAEDDQAAPGIDRAL